MATPLQEFRSRYPQYNELSDDELADQLHQRFYSDMAPEDFRATVGLTPETPPPEPPTDSDRLDSHLSRVEANDEIGERGALKPPEKVRRDSTLDLAHDAGLFEPLYSDWEAQQRGDLNNSLRLAAERGSSLLGRAVRGIVGRPGEALERKYGLGQIVFGTDWGPEDPADGKFRVRYMNHREFQEFKRREEVENVFSDTVPDYLTSREFGGETRHTPEQIKQAYHAGDITGTLGAVFNFGMEQGIQSVPDMVAVMAGPFGLGAYVGARSDEIGEARAENKGQVEQTFQEQMEALPFAVGSALFERFGAKKIVDAFGKEGAEDLGQELMEVGLKNAAKRITKKAGGAAAVEAGTEAFQEGVIEYLGERLGTDAPMSWEEAVEQGFFGALAGGQVGGIAGGAVATAGETTRAMTLKTLERNASEQRPTEAPDTDFDEGGEVVTVEPTAGQADTSRETPRTDVEGEGVETPPPATEADTAAPQEGVRTVPDQPINPDPAPAPEVPRETEQEAPDPDTAPAGAEYFDSRLKRDSFRFNLAGMADSLTGTRQPTWFESLQNTELALSPRRTQQATQKALTGQRLGVREAKVVGHMLDRLTAGRTAPSVLDHARAQLDQARETRRKVRSRLQAGEKLTLEPLTDIESRRAGERFQETDYLPEMDAEARIVDELGHELDEWGFKDDVDKALDAANTTSEAITALERLKHIHREAGRAYEQQTAETRPESPPSAVDQRQETDLPPAPDQAGTPTAEPLGPPADTGERRTDIGRRQRVSQMTPDQLLDELYTDPLTGLANERAFNEDLPNATAVGSIDADGLGGVNDHLGHDAGDAMLQAVGQALADTGLEAYHKSGDEFYVLGDNPGQVAAALNQAREALQLQVLETAKGRLTGIHITTGVGGTKNQADSKMEAAKHERARLGQRNPKGQLPPGGVVYAASPLNMEAGTNYVGRQTDMPLTPNNEYRLGNGRTVRIPEQPVRRHHILARLQRKFGNKIYQGRVKGKTRLGFYRIGIGEIRIKHANDLEVTAHEFGHWLDDRHPWIGNLYRQFDEEMRGISYDVEKPFEGYAEFMRHWFTQEHIARENAPGFYDAWMAALEEHPGIRDTAYEIQELMHAWHLQGARKRLEDRIGHQVPLIDRFRASVRGWQDRLLQNVFDEIRPFKEAERTVSGGVGNAARSGYNSLRLARGSHGVVQAIFHKGTINWNARGDLEFTGKGLNDIFRPVSNKMLEMQLYMVARRAEELTEQDRENLIPEDEIRRGLQLGDENPEFAAVFDEYQQFNQRMMDFYEASGLLTPDSRAAMEEANKNYVPFNRVVETTLGETRVKAGGSPFIRLKGGTSNINDVFENIIGNTSNLVHMALVNRGKQNFYEMLERSDNQTAALYAVPIGKDSKPTPIDQNQVVRKVLDAMGLDRDWYRMGESGLFKSKQEQAQWELVRDMIEGLEPMVTFFQHGQDPSGDVDFYFADGKKRYFEIADPALYEAIQSLGPRTHNLALSILGGFANVLRRGVTLWPAFRVRNFIRDNLNSFTLSKGQVIPVVEPVQSLMERFYNDEHYWQFMLNGGGFSGMVEASGMSRDKVIDTRGKLAYFLEHQFSADEYSARLAEFKALREKGWSARDAALAGREISTDFAMRGSSEFLRIFTTSIPFLNARLQGLYRNGRELMSLERGRPQFAGKQAFSYALRSLIGITIPSIILYLLNRDDERYQELPDWKRDLSWVVFTGEGEDDYVMFPKPFETGFAWGSLPERMIEAMEKDDQTELVDAMLWMAMETFQMDMIPQIYKPLDELKRNKNFTGAPIIPEYMQTVEPMEQYRAYTSDAMIALGRKLNISPLKAEHLVRGYFGSLGNAALSLADNMAGDVTNSGAEPTKSWKGNILLSSFVNDGPLRRTHSENHLYDLLKETRTVANTVRIMSARSPERLEAYISTPRQQVLMGLNDTLSEAASEMREINNAIDMIRAEPTYSGDEKRREIHALQRDKNEITRSVYSNLDPEAVQALIDEAEAATQQAKQARATPSLRPFNPGEFVRNSDGSSSTERSVTIQDANGAWVNVPSLWMGANGPVDLGNNEDRIFQAMTEFERGGVAFPRFETLEQAVAAARDRSEHGGAFAGPARAVNE